MGYVSVEYGYPIMYPISVREFCEVCAYHRRGEVFGSRDLYACERGCRGPGRRPRPVLARIAIG